MAEVHVRRVEAHLDRLRALEAAQAAHHQRLVDQRAAERAEAERVAAIERDGQEANRAGR